MKVTQMINSNNNPAANQFILADNKKQTFQSYDTIIAHEFNTGKIVLDSKAMDYSKTTSKHLYIFLGMNKKEILQGVKNKSIQVKNLNK